jgi:hypothetical protein
MGVTEINSARIKGLMFKRMTQCSRSFTLMCLINIAVFWLCWWVRLRTSLSKETLSKEFPCDTGTQTTL